MTTIELKYNYGFKWYQKNGIYVIGYLFDKEDNLYQNENLISYFEAVADFDGFKDRLIHANGMFSVIISNDECTMIGSDIIRTFPVFYYNDNQNLNISDDAQYLARAFLKGIDELRSIEFLAAGYTTGKFTLFTDIYQIQPAQIICFRNGKEEKSEFYYSYITDSVFEYDYEELKRMMQQVVNNVFRRLIRSVGNRQIIVPLSGGFDSRLIAAALKNNGIDNVICITYGKKSAIDAPLSKKAAEKLGFKWIFIEHTAELIKNYYNSDEFLNYYPYAANGFTFSYLFEYFGARYLKHIIGIPEDSVFIAGHSGDFLGGSQITKFGIAPEWSLDTAVNKLFRLKYNFIIPANRYKALFKKEIRTYLEKGYLKQGRMFSYSFVEDWDYREKLSKMNANSSRVFSYFGFQYRLPYWDKEIVEFFRQVPYQYKLHKKLYDEVLNEYYFKHFNLIFPDEIRVSSFTYMMQRMKTYLKPYAPYFIKKQSNLKVDWSDYHLITAPMAQDLRNAGIPFRIYDVPFNSVIMQWYLAKMKELI